MNKFAKFSGPGAGLLIIILVLAFHWAAVYWIADWAAGKTIEANRKQDAARAAEFKATVEALNKAHDEMIVEIELMRGVRDQVKYHEYLLRSKTPVSRSIADRSRQVLVTAYTCNDGDKKTGDRGYCVTASGHVLQQSDAWGYVAADPKFYSFGQRLYIEGVGQVIVVDTGSYIKGPNRLDLFVGETDIKLAKTWGSVRKEVRI